MPTLEGLRALGERLRRTRYADAAALLVAGSVVRGEGTPASDLDIVVVYERLPQARRESFVFEGWPVEAFIHDPETMYHFFTEVDGPRGIPMLPRMVAEGIEAPGPTVLTRRLKAVADEVIAAGPPALSEQAVKWTRYLIADAMDDIRHAPTQEQKVAAGAALYGRLGDAWFRLRGAWSAQGKALPKAMRRADASFAARFAGAFGALFQYGETDALDAIAREVLAPVGGPFAFAEGYAQDAPPSARKSLPEQFR